MCPWDMVDLLFVRTGVSEDWWMVAPGCDE
jgi:hypothetical protein